MGSRTRAAMASAAARAPLMVVMQGGHRAAADGLLIREAGALVSARLVDAIRPSITLGVILIPGAVSNVVW